MQHKVLGSTLIIAGTTIGGGMVVMPLTSAGLGFGMTMVLLFGLWILLCYSALLFVEVYQTGQKTDGIARLAEMYFGPIGRVVTSASLLVFMYAILAFYVTTGGNIVLGIGDSIKSLIPEAIELDKGSILIFTIGLGIFIIFGTSMVDGVNRIFFSAKTVAFALILILMLPLVHVANLFETPANNWLFLSAAPVFFTAFGFHVAIPSVVSYLDGDIRNIRFSIVVGTAIPLFAYVMWQLATHGVLPQAEFVALINKDPSLDGFFKVVQQITGSGIITQTLRIFSALALITSFLGVALALFDFLRDLLDKFKLPSNRYVLGLLTFVPPLIFALFYPKGFFAALAYAGILFAFYGLILPIGLAFKARRRYRQEPYPYQVKGGNFALIIALIVGLIIIAIPFFQSAGYLPKVIG